MMRFALPVAFFLLSAAILALPCDVEAVEYEPAAPPGFSFDSPVEDKAIEIALFAAARSALDEGRIFSKTNYEQQLKRIVTTHALAAQSEQELTGPEIYAQAAKATLTLLVADEKTLRKHFIDPEDEESEEEERDPKEIIPIQKTSPIKRPPPDAREGIGFGTAFIISEDGIGVTNFHVLEHMGPCIVVGVDSYGKPHEVVEILAADRDTDIAIFRLAPGKYPYLPIRKDLPAGSPIYVFSHPGRNTNTFCAGVVTRYAVLNLGKARKERKITWMSIDAVFAPGSSGGAILDNCGNAVGVVSFGIVIRKEQQGMPFTSRYCVPAGMILRLVIPPEELKAPSGQFSIGTMVGVNQGGKSPQEVRQIS